MVTTDMRKIAETRVDTRFGFYIHAFVFAAVITLLWTINLSKTPDNLWAYWPTGGWGIGLICHGIAARLRLATTAGPGSLRDRLVDAELQNMSGSDRA